MATPSAPKASPSPAAPQAAPSIATEEINSVIVRNVAQTIEPPTEKVLADFFSFCGNIAALTIAPDDRDPSGSSAMAVVTFESKAAARTAVLLNNALINEKAIQVELAPPNFRLVSDASSPHGGVKSVSPATLPRIEGADDRSQTSVVASLLARGYTLSANAVNSARKFDEEKGISKKASEIADQAAAGVRDIDEKLGVSATLQTFGTTIQQKASEIGQTYQVTEKAQVASQVLGDWGRTFSSGLQNVAQQGKDLVDQSPALQNATQTIAGWGTAVAGVFRDAKTISEQEQAAQGVQLAPGQDVPQVAPAPVVEQARPQ